MEDKTESMTQQIDLRQLALEALDDLKAIDVRVLDVAKLTTITDHMIVALGRSDRHVRSLAENVVMSAKKAGVPPVGVEGEKEGEWVLVDLGDVIVHVMTRESRDFYALEKLWGMVASERGDNDAEDSAQDNAQDNALENAPVNQQQAQ